MSNAIFDLKRYIFVDLDDTLTHSILVDKNYCRKRGDRTLIKVEADDTVETVEYYAALVKKNTDGFLKYLRDNYDRVLMLTLAYRSYAKAHNDAFSLGFKDSDILSCESIAEYSRFTNDRFIGVLLDNLPKEHKNSWLKHQYITQYADDAKYRHIHMRTFEGHSTHSFDLELAHNSGFRWHINYNFNRNE